MLSDPTDPPKLTQPLLPLLQPAFNVGAAPSAAQAPMHAKLVVVILLLLLLAIQNLWALMVPFYVFVQCRGDAPPERPVA